MPKVKQVGM